jgi:diphthine-ammonia ligase
MASSRLNVIALISGGKDSLFSILHCQANGHTIVALANLHPGTSSCAKENNDNEDIDSYMYQTVGHAIIPLYEEALGIPLYRQEITGKAVNSSRDYEQQSPTQQEQEEQDETEDLVPLLEKVLKAHPEANAVSTGAILSTYQRTRVESVALRLGLTPLSFLWQYPLLPPYTQTALLHDMAAVGQEAVIIKTASGGLDESLLSLDVAHQKTIARLSKAMARFGEATNGAIVGEGGEFETLALDGPRALWRKKIKIVDAESVVVGGGQSVLRIKECRLEDKSGDRDDEMGELRIPPLWDEEFEKILDVMENTRSGPSVSVNDTIVSTSPVPDAYPAIENLPKNTSTNTPTVFTSSNLSIHPSPSSHISPSRQLTTILLRLNHMLQQGSLLKSHINHCTLLLRDMSDFTVLNPIYASYFSDINPPARVTIAVGDTLPAGIDVMLSIVLDKIERKDRRQGLHVQGRSYWAPANIGPYSQAISVPLPLPSSSPPTTHNNDTNETQQNASEIVYIAGQIPLLPAPMTVYTTHNFTGQVLLSLQHLWRIGRAKSVRWWIAGVAFIPDSVAKRQEEDCVGIVRDAWERLHTTTSTQDDNEDDEDEDVDPWDKLNTTTGAAFNNETYRAQIPDHTVLRTNDASTTTTTTPPCFVVQVSSLPRDVDIEWSATGLTAESIAFDGSISAPVGSRSQFRVLEIRERRDCKKVKEYAWTSATLYAGRGFEWDGEWELEGMQWIPCQRVWGAGGEEVWGVVVGRVDGE